MKLFLCHSSADSVIAEEVHVALLDAGHEVFFDRTTLPAGGDYHTRIRNGIRDSEGFIFLISPDSVRKGSYTLTELKFAREKWPTPSGAVLPVMVRHTDYKSLDPYLAAVTVLEPSGNVAAEVAAEVDKWSRESEAPVDSTLQTDFTGMLNKIMHAYDRQGHPASTAAAAPERAPAVAVSLAQVLPGAWQVQINYPNGLVGQAMQELYANGMFRGQLNSPMGAFALEGTWQWVPVNQLLFMGQMSDGYRAMPFTASLQLIQTTPNMLVGVMNTGERVIWTRVG